MYYYIVIKKNEKNIGEMTPTWTLTFKAHGAARCHLSLHACNRSLFARGPSIDSRAYVISQHVRWPIRTPPPTCVNQDAWVVITTKRLKANSIHTATRHAWTRTLARNTVQKAVFSLIHFPASFIRLWPSCHFEGVEGGSRQDWGLFLEQTEFLKTTLEINKYQFGGSISQKSTTREVPN